MKTRAFLYSLLLHGAVLGLLLLDISFTAPVVMKATPALVMVDLTKIPLADKTNLPPKKTPTKAPKPKPKPVAAKKQPAPTPTTVKPSPKPQEKPVIQPKEKPAPKEAVKTVEQKKEPVKKTTPAPAKTPVQPTPKPQPASAKKTGGDLKSLLASVEKLKKPVAAPADTPAEEERTATEGVEGGTGGSYTQALSVSDTDLIAAKLRRCWNVDAGVAGIDEMIIEIRAYLNRDGRVQDVKILNMKADDSFRAIADSARRAVYICDRQGEESPFKILSERYGDKYNTWKEIFLRFNPMEGSVF